MFFLLYKKNQKFDLRLYIKHSLKHIVFPIVDLTVPCFNFGLSSNEKKNSLIGRVT